mgnify:CR=1 FL=1
MKQRTWSWEFRTPRITIVFLKTADNQLSVITGCRQYRRSPQPSVDVLTGRMRPCNVLGKLRVMGHDEGLDWTVTEDWYGPEVYMENTGLMTLLRKMPLQC